MLVAFVAGAFTFVVVMIATQLRIPDLFTGLVWSVPAAVAATAACSPPFLKRVSKTITLNHWVLAILVCVAVIAVALVVQCIS